jgi:hypothetical protein
LLKLSLKQARLSLTQSKVLNLQTRPEATFSPRVDGDPGRNLTPVAAARCPTVGANCLKEICPRGNNNIVIIIFLVHDNVYTPCYNCIKWKH